MREALLFSSARLSDYLEKRKKEAIDDVQQQDTNYILNVNPADFYEYIAQKYLLRNIVLDESKITVDQQEVEVDVSGDRRLLIDRTHPYRTGTRVTYFVPFEGNPELFKYIPSTRNSNPPRGIVKGQVLELSFEGVDITSEKIRTEFDRKLTEIKTWIGWVTDNVSNYNEHLPTLIEKQTKTRREKLLRDSGLVAELGFPMKKREDAPTTYAVPEVKRKIIPKPLASTAPFKPEPTIPIEEYDHILSIICNMTLVMERSPKAFQSMKEPDIRQHFLVQLNGHYEGKATGETFNYEGKTDILIRSQGKNIFIAECKFWKGAEAFLETIDQILNYLSWRDTKTAILLFNRNRNFSNVLEQIPVITKKHPNFKSQMEYKSESGFRFVFRKKDDTNRDLLLTILAFDVPSS
jgi:hypothetical protein